MAKLRRQKSKDALRVFKKYEDEIEDVEGFQKDLISLVKEVQNDTELSLMRGEVRHLGEKHMLLSNLYSAISLCSRPVHREASFTMVKQSLDKYLGITVEKLPTKRRRRRLLLKD